MSKPPPSTPSILLTSWLCGLVRSRNTGALADLRRPTALTEARLLASHFAPCEEHRLIYEKIAFLFARYHAGALTPSPGHGDLGTALRRIGSPACRGPADPGAKRMFDLIAASRHIPWRHLQHAIERSRACEAIPPSWALLTDHLTQWTTRGRPTAYAWARSFYTPTFQPRPIGDPDSAIPTQNGTAQ